MSFRKNLFLSLVCFTLDTAAVFAGCPGHCSSGGVAAVTIDADGGSDSCGWANAIDCVNVGASVIDLRVRDTDLLSNTPADFQRSCSVISTVSGGTGLSTDRGAHLVRIHRSGVVVNIGPSSSPQGVWFSSSGGTPIGRVDVERGRLELGPQFSYPTSTAACQEFHVWNWGLILLGGRGTCGVPLRVGTDHSGVFDVPGGVSFVSASDIRGHDSHIYIRGYGGSSFECDRIGTHGIDLFLENIDFKQRRPAATHGWTTIQPGNVTYTLLNSMTMPSSRPFNVIGNLSMNVGSGHSVTMEGTLEGGGAFSKTGAGILTLRGNTALTGPTSVTGGGILSIGLGSSSLSGGAVTLGGDGSFSSLRLYRDTAISTVTVNENAQLSLHANASITNAVMEHNGWITFGDSTKHLSVANLVVPSAGSHNPVFFMYDRNVVDFIGSITGSSYLSLWGISSGSSQPVVNLRSPTAFNGNFYLLDTVLNVRGANAFGGVPGLEIRASSIVNLSTSVRISRLVGDSSSTINMGANSLTLDVRNTSDTYSGLITGSGRVFFEQTNGGSNTQVLTAVNPYTGTTFIRNGATVQITNTQALGTNSLVLESGGTLILPAGVSFAKYIECNSGTGTFSVPSGSPMYFYSTLAGPGRFAYEGGGTYVFLGDQPYSGGTTIGVNTTVQIPTSLSLGHSSSLLTLTNGATVNPTTSLTIPYDLNLAGTSGIISTSGALSIVLSGQITGAGGLTLSGPSTYTIADNSNAYAWDTTLQSGARVYFTSPGCLGNGSLITIGDACTLQPAGNMTLSQGPNFSGGTAVIDVGSSFRVAFSGSARGAGGFTLTSGGTLALAPGAWYSGATSIIGNSTLEIGAGSALGSTSSLSIQGGSELLVTGTTELTRNVVLSPASSPVTINVGSGRVATLSGSISGSAPLNVVGGGTVFLRGNNSSSGATTIASNTTLQVNGTGSLGSGALTVQSGAELFVTGSGGNITPSIALSSGRGTIGVDVGATATTLSAISGSGGLTAEGGGTLVLGVANSYAGTTEIKTPVQISAGNQLGNAASVELYAGGVLLTGGSSVFTQSKSISLQGVGTISPGSASTMTLSGAITGGYGINYSGSGTVVLPVVNTYTGDTTLSSSVIVQASSDTSFGTGNFVFSGGGSLYYTSSEITSRQVTFSSGEGTLIMDGSERLTLTGKITGSGDIRLQGGEFYLSSTLNDNSGVVTLANGTTLAIDTASNLGSPSLLSMGTSTTLSIQSPSAITLTTPISLSSGAATIELSGSTTSQGGITGVGPLLLTGSGTFIPKGSNTYTAGTTIQDGVILQISETTSIGTSGTLTFNGGGVLSVIGSATLPTSMSLLSGTGTVQIEPSVTLTLASVISGDGNLAISGGGIFNLQAINTYTGFTRVDAATILALSGDGDLSASSSVILEDTSILAAGSSFTLKRPISLSSGTANVNLGSSYAVTLSGDITGAGSVNIDGSGSLLLEGANTFADITVNDGVTLQTVANENLSGAGILFLNNGGIFTPLNSLTLSKELALTSGTGEVILSGGDTFTVAGDITGSGDLLLSGSGTFYPSGAKSYDGDTRISTGVTVQVQDSNALGDTGDLLFEGGGVLYIAETISLATGLDFVSGSATVSVASGKTGTITGNVIGSGSLDVAQGVLRLEGTNSYSGTTTVLSGAILELTSNLGVGIGELRLENNGALSLAGAITVTRNLTLLQGTGIISTAPSIAASYGGVISGDANLSVQGSGAVELLADNTYTGVTKIQGGGTLQASLESNLGQNPALEIDDNSNFIATATLTLSTPVTLTGGFGGVGSAGHTLTINNEISGDGGLFVKGTGLFLPYSSNTYKGDTKVISGATIQVTEAGNLGLGEYLILEGGSTFSIISSIDIDKKISLGTGEATFALADDKSITFSDVIEDVSGQSGSLYVSGAATYIPTKTNTYTGSTRAGSGTTVQISSESNLGNGSLITLEDGSTLAVMADGAIAKELSLVTGTETVFIPASVTVSYDGQVTGAGSFIKSGDGNLIFTNAVNTYGGATTVAGGVLSIDRGEQLGVSTTGPITVERAATLKVTGASTLIAPFILSAGGELRIDNGSETIFTKDFTWIGDGLLDTPEETNVTVNGVMDVTAADSIKINGGSTLLLNDLNVGTRNLRAYSLDQEPEGNVKVSGTGTFQGELTVSNLNFIVASESALSVDADVSLGTSGTLTLEGGNSVVVGDIAGSDGSTIDLGLVGDDLTTKAKTSSSSFTGLIRGEGDVRFSLAPGVTSNEMTLGSTNTYTGTTTIEEGVTLKVGASNSLGNSADFYFDEGGTLLASNSLSLPLNFHLGSTGAEINLGSNRIVYVDGVVQDSAPLILSGTGMFIPTASNSYTGSTTITDGITVQIEEDSNLGSSGSFIFASGGILEVTKSTTLARGIELQVTNGTINAADGVTATVSGVISGDGDLIVDGTGTVVLLADNLYTGHTSIEADTTLSISKARNLGNPGARVKFAGGGTLVSTGTFSIGMPVQIQDGTATVSPSAGQTLTLDQEISEHSGTGFLVISGEGTVSLGATNTYTGSTTIVGSASASITADDQLGVGGELIFSEGGTLISAAASDFALNRQITLSSGEGIIDLTTNKTLTAAQIITGPGALRITGISTFIPQYANDYTGGTTLTPGITAQISNNNNLGDDTGALTFDGGGTLKITEDITLNRDVILGSSTGIINLDGSTLSGPNASFDYQVSGVGSLSLVGGGTYIPSNGNTYEGTTTLESGVIVKVGSDTALGNGGALIFNGGGTLELTNNISLARGVELNGSGVIDLGENRTLYITGVISESGPLSIAGSGTFFPQNSNTYGGGTTIVSGVTVSIAAENNLGNGGTFTFDGGGTLVVTSAITLAQNINLGTVFGEISIAEGLEVTATGLFSNSGGLEVTGAGTLVLTDTSNSYSGGTDLGANATLKIADPDVLGSGGLTFNQGGSLYATASMDFDRLITISNGEATLIFDGGTILQISENIQEINGIGSLRIKGTGGVYIQSVVKPIQALPP